MQHKEIKEQKKEEHVCKFVPYLNTEGYGYEIIKTTDLPGLGVLIIYEKHKEVARVVCAYCVQCGAKV